MGAPKATTNIVLGPRSASVWADKVPSLSQQLLPGHCHTTPIPKKTAPVMPKMPWIHKDSPSKNTKMHTKRKNTHSNRAAARG